MTSMRPTSFDISIGLPVVAVIFRGYWTLEESHSVAFKVFVSITYVVTEADKLPAWSTQGMAK